MSHSTNWGKSSSIDDWWTEFGPDSPSNWNFDDVPDAEVIACCLWEYARESPTIRMAADIHWCHVRHIVHRQAYAENPPFKAEHDKEAENIQSRAERGRFDYDRFFDDFWNTDFPFMAIYESVTKHVGDWADPWQRLPQQLRLQLSKQVPISTVLQPITPATVGELEQLWLKNSGEVRDIRSRPRPPNDDSEDAALFNETEPFEHLSTEDGALNRGLTVGLTVDLSRFTDRELLQAFKEWLGANRPQKWKTPRRFFPNARQKGRKSLEYRVGLERLGLMRLLHWHSPAELQTEIPKAWKAIGHKQEYFRREIREACKLFHKLFPFLPNAERPQSEQRAGMWRPALARIADEVVEEMATGRGKKSRLI